MATYQFFDLCREEFRFLEEEFDFRSPEAESIGHGRGLSMTYLTDVVAVKVAFEPMEFLAYTYLYRLRDGKMPVYTLAGPGSYDRDVESRFMLDHLVGLRCPDRVPARAFRPEFEGKDLPGILRLILREQATLVRDFAADVLRGEFTVYAELPRIRKERLEWAAEYRRRQKDSSAS